MNDEMQSLRERLVAAVNAAVTDREEVLIRVCEILDEFFRLDSRAKPFGLKAELNATQNYLSIRGEIENGIGNIGIVDYSLDANGPGFIRHSNLVGGVHAKVVLSTANAFISDLSDVVDRIVGPASAPISAA
jgi:hypothetical protein